MALLNVFRGHKTGLIQESPSELGVSPPITIPGEDFLELIETKER